MNILGICCNKCLVNWLVVFDSYLNHWILVNCSFNLFLWWSLEIRMHGPLSMLTLKTLYEKYRKADYKWSWQNKNKGQNKLLFYFSYRSLSTLAWNSAHIRSSSHSIQTINRTWQDRSNENIKTAIKRFDSINTLFIICYN